LRHQSIKVDDALSRNLIQLLDGSHDRGALLAALLGLVRSAEAAVPDKGEPASDVPLAAARLPEELEANLGAIARVGLLIG
jgi:hypothetical protein